MDQLHCWLLWLSNLQLSELQLWLSQPHSLDQANPDPAELQPSSTSLYSRLFSCRSTPTSPTVQLPRCTPCLFSTSQETSLSSTASAPRLSRTSRCLPALALALPTLPSIYLAITYTRLYGSSSFVTFVRDSRASVQILVQVLAHVLSLAQVYCLCKLFNFVTRLKVERAALTLRKLSLWSALSNVKIDPSLPPGYLLLTIFVAVLSIVPGALWAGALTPVVTVGRNLTASVDVPSYSTRSAKVWDSEFQLEEYNNVWNRISNCTTVHDRRGLIPSCPVPGLQALLLLSASTATVVDGRPRIHAKLDNPHWTYTGRSYGVGSSIGLTLPSFGPSDGNNLIASIRYLESGYDAQVECIRNSSSDITVEYGGTFGPDPVGYYALQGRLPNEPPEVKAEFYPIPVFNSSFQKIAAWAARSWEGRNTLAIATGAGGPSSILNKIQCEVVFIPEQFHVSVNRTSNVITATTVSSPAKDIEASGNLKSNVIQSLNLLSRMSPSLYQSVIGDALMINVQNLQTRLNTTKIDDSIITRAVASSFTAMIDDILVAYGASQLVIARDSTPVKAFGDAYGVQLGDLAYIYAALVLNVIIVAAWLVESVRTRFWCGLSKFNYVHLTSMVLAASAGGTDVARTFQHWHTRNGLDDWDGDGGHPAFDAIRIQVRQRRIVPASADGAVEIMLDSNDHGNGRARTLSSKMYDFSTYANAGREFD